MRVNGFIYIYPYVGVAIYAHSDVDTCTHTHTRATAATADLLRSSLAAGRQPLFARRSSLVIVSRHS